AQRRVCASTPDGFPFFLCPAELSLRGPVQLQSPREAGSLRLRTPLRRGGTAMDDFRAGGRAGGEGRAERSQTEQRLPACAGRALARDTVAWAVTAPCPPPDRLYTKKFGQLTRADF